MSGPVDLNAYCARIGYSGPLSASPETLRALQLHHIRSVPFEAIDVLLGRRIDLSPAAVDGKIMGQKRGGYCHEQNSLFERVLRAIGFRVERMLGRVLWMAPAGAEPPRTHMALRVALGGQDWLVDVAFGANVPPEPLRLGKRGAQPTEFESYRVSRGRSGVLLEARIEQSWRPLYLLSEEAAFASDVELANWYSATHPDSAFRNRLTVALTADAGRYALLDNRLTFRARNGRTERNILSAGGIERALRGIFGLRVEEAWRPVIARAAASAAAPAEAPPRLALEASA